MREDSILREIRRIKDENAAKYGYDVRALRQSTSKRATPERTKVGVASSETSDTLICVGKK